MNGILIGVQRILADLMREATPTPTPIAHDWAVPAVEPTPVQEPKEEPMPKSVFDHIADILARLANIEAVVGIGGDKAKAIAGEVAAVVAMVPAIVHPDAPTA